MDSTTDHPRTPLLPHKNTRTKQGNHVNREVDIFAVGSGNPVCLQMETLSHPEQPTHSENCSNPCVDTTLAESAQSETTGGLSFGSTSDQAYTTEHSFLSLPGNRSERHARQDGPMRKKEQNKIGVYEIRGKYLALEDIVDDNRFDSRLPGVKNVNLIQLGQLNAILSLILVVSCLCVTGYLMYYMFHCSL